MPLNPLVILFLPDSARVDRFRELRLRLQLAGLVGWLGSVSSLSRERVFGRRVQRLELEKRPLGDHRWSPWTQSDGNRADRLEKKEGDGGRGEETGG